MSLETARLGIIRQGEFVNRTRASGRFIHPQRGSGMRQIDTALEVWDRVSQDATSTTMLRLQSLSALIYECEAWCRQRQGKQSPLCDQRRQVIQTLARDGARAHSYLSNKFKAEQMPHAANAKPHRGGVKALEPGFANERAHYVQQNKQADPHSASNVVEALGPDQDIGQLDLAGFTAAAAQHNVLPVEFMNRAARLEHLVVVENGRLTRDGQNINHVNGNRLDCDTYVADRYGNLFSKPFVYSANSYFNHSSYCAGKEVLCAGTIGCDNGQLVYVSNMSGHYKPNAGYLLIFLHMLMGEGVDMTDVLVESMDLGTSLRATTFIANAQAVDDWPHWIGAGNNRRVAVNGGGAAVWNPA